MELFHNKKIEPSFLNILRPRKHNHSYQNLGSGKHDMSSKQFKELLFKSMEKKGHGSINIPIKTEVQFSDWSVLCCDSTMNSDVNQGSTRFREDMESYVGRIIWEKISKLGISSKCDKL